MRSGYTVATRQYAENFRCQDKKRWQRDSSKLPVNEDKIKTNCLAVRNLQVVIVQKI
jgi:hypothetical protein